MISAKKAMATLLEIYKRKAVDLNHMPPVSVDGSAITETVKFKNTKR